MWISEISFTIYGALWLKNYYGICELPTHNQNLILGDLKIQMIVNIIIFTINTLGLVIGNSVLFVTAVITIWCSFDIAGRSWVKLKKYQKSLRDQNTKTTKKFYRRSGGNSNRSWRHRYVLEWP